MENEFSMKELYEVFLKTTYPIEIAGRRIETGETLCVFDKIQIANFIELKQRTTAHGGLGDRDRVFWEDTKGIDITFSQGIFNILQFGLLANSKMLYVQKGENLLISKREETESDENGVVKISETPVNQLFIYNKKTGERIVDYSLTGNKEIKINSPFTDVILDYQYAYVDGAQQLTVGKQLIEGFLRLEGKTRVKDDISGKVRTGIFVIPKLKLMSDLSMRLGKNANPVVANFRARALPNGNGKNVTCMDMFFLNDDIDSDM